LATPARSTGSMRDKHVTRSSAAPANGKRNGAKASGRAPVVVPGNGRPASKVEAKPEAKILFQKFFHSVGPRTYAAQVKELGNGNHLLVLTEGKRDSETGEVRKTRLLIFGEDFTAFFKLLAETAGFIRANPLSEEIREKRRRVWAKRNKEARAAGRPAAE
jgi:Protein of unknown function (DUF3276)